MTYDIAIIGGGIVGLATAWQLHQKYPEKKVVLWEKEEGPARHQTGHNSGVIHSGIYYKPGSLKAKNCLEGYSLLIEFCNTYNVPYDLCGKIIVATEERELPTLDMLYNRGIENGLENLKMLSPEEIKEIEPHCTGIKGIWVPQTGIIDYKQVAEKLVELLRNKGVEIQFSCSFDRMEKTTSGMRLFNTSGKSIETLKVVNCAGLYSDKVAKKSGANVRHKIVPFRGEYYALKPEAKHLVKNLIYPVPDTNFPFLGVHFTRMMNGETEAGPNAVLAYAREGYSKSKIRFSELFETLFFPGFQKVAFKYWRTGLGEIKRSYSKAAFTKALQKLLPEIREEHLYPGGAGVRAQACDPEGGLIDDFYILQEEHVVNVCNAPSPAATSSLAIGKYISSLV